jgi:hypothetical protein
MKNRRQGLGTCGATHRLHREARCSSAGTGPAPPTTGPCWTTPARWLTAGRCRQTEQDLAGALARLARLGKPTALPVIIERASGLVVQRLLAPAGHPVVPVHPTAFWAARPRWGASGAKSDAGDSDKLAEDLRTDGHRLRPLGKLDAGLHELQALVRLPRGSRAFPRTAASRKLGALLEAHWPGPKAVLDRLASPIALAFLADYPTPQAAARLGEARMASLLQTAQLPRRQATSGAAGQARFGADRAGWHPGSHAGSAYPDPGPGCYARCLPPSPTWSPGSRHAWPAIPAQPSSQHYPVSAPSTWPSCLPRSARFWTASAAPSRPPPCAARRRSPRPVARPAGSPSAGPPTVEPARR